MSRCCRETTSATMMRCHKGTQMRVPWHFGVREGGCLEMTSSSQRGPTRPARATAGSIAHQHEKPGCPKNQSDSGMLAHSTTNPPCTCYPHTSPFHPAVRKSTCFSSQGPLRGCCVVLGDVKATKHCNTTVWWPSHLHHVPSHPSPCSALKGALAERVIWALVAGFEPR